MPIVSRTLVLLANREDMAPGVKRWRVQGLDARGGRWVKGPFTSTLVQAEVIRDTAWAIAELEDHDEQVGYAHIEAGGDPDSFVREDIGLNEWRKRVAKRFWKATIETDRQFLCTVAPYIASFTSGQIAGSLGISQARAQAGLDKAVDLRDNVCPLMTDIDDKADPV